jgi:Phosphoinositide phospholipase C, Ca2+-dependent
MILPASDDDDQPGQLMADSWRYGEAVFKASHNSYDRDERPVTEQLTWQRSQPHQAGCRGLELDLCESPNLTMWAVDHNDYQPQADRQLSAYLRHLRLWSTFHPGHDVITVTLDLKSRARDLRQFPRHLDATIDEHLGADLLFTPAQLMGGMPSLVAGASATGWPTLAELRGRYILCLSGDEATKRNYARANNVRLCFADQKIDESDSLPSTASGDRVFFNYNATETWPWHDRIRWFAAQDAFVTRAYVVNSQDLWDRVVAADTNIIATDKVRNHAWAHVGPEPFARITGPAQRA